MSFKRYAALHMPKVLLIWFLTVLLVVLSIPLGGAAAADAESVKIDKPVSGKNGVSASAVTGESVTLTVNYYRPKGDYADYDMWIWAMPAGDGALNDHEFNAGTVEFPGYEGKKWKTMTTVVDNVDTALAKAIGVIVRQGGDKWSDQTADMHVDGSKIKDNAVTVYIVQDIETVYYTVEDAMSIKILQASFEDFETVYFTTSQKITTSSLFVLRDENDTECGRLEVTEQTADKAYAYIDLTVDFDFAKTYTIYDIAEPFDKEVNFSPKEVSKTSLYDIDEFTSAYGYDGSLGVEYTPEKSTFRVWSPIASEVTLNIYANGDTDNTSAQKHGMVLGDKGVWTAEVAGDLNGKYYTYSVGIGSSVTEIVDPYARSGGRNGERGMIIDLDTTDPDGWNDLSKHSIPDYGSTAKAMSTAVIYEAQLRDLTIHESSGVSAANRGKFLGLTETGTVNGKGQATALDHIKELGVTQVHFQPLFDFASVDENFTRATYNKTGEYNWGYDPLNYNMPEGSYSSDPADGSTRVVEMKKMVMALHNAGIQVIMDVVYNHVSSAPSSNFEALVPGYYFRTNAEGKFLNGSGCGNETASERYMFRKFMIDSVKYWTEEYKIDGFRFDLMALHDIDTMNAIYAELSKINPDVMIYGEGWDAGSNGLPASDQAKMANAQKMPNIAVFDDILRDGLKGGVFDIAERGFMTGLKGREAAVYVGAAGGTNVYTKYSILQKSSFALNPTQNVNYISAHDNSTLWDKMNASVPASTDAESVKAMYRMAAASVLTSQGASFFLAGEEMLRSKPTTATFNKDTGMYENSEYDNRPYAWNTDPEYIFSDNSYKSPDSVNAVNWDLLDENRETVDFYKGMIAVKKSYPQFRISSRSVLKQNLFFIDGTNGDGIASYMVKDPDSMSFAVVLFNTNTSARQVTVPQGEYDVIVNGQHASTQALSVFKGSTVTVESLSTLIMVGDLTDKALYGFNDIIFKDFKPISDGKTEGDDTDGLALGLGIGIPAAALVAGGAVFAVLYSKKKRSGKRNGDVKADDGGSDAADTDGDGIEPDGTNADNFDGKEESGE